MATLRRPAASSSPEPLPPRLRREGADRRVDPAYRAEMLWRIAEFDVRLWRSFWGRTPLDRRRELLSLAVRSPSADDEWRVESDGVGELHVFCPECWQREFGGGA